MRVLICGARDSKREVVAMLNAVHRDRPISCVIGDGTAGAAAYAKDWAAQIGICYMQIVKTHWCHSRTVSRQQHLEWLFEFGQPDLVIGFMDDSKNIQNRAGDVVRMAAAREIEVVRVGA